MKRSEFWSAMMLAALHVILFSTVVSLLETYTNLGLSPAEYNFIYYCVSAVLTVVLLHEYLRRSFDVLLDNFWGCLKWFIIAWILYWALDILINVLFSYVKPDVANPNNQQMGLLAADGYKYVFAMTVFLAPVVEECIFRGGFFQGILPKGRVLAYVVSIAAFGIYHVWKYALMYKDPSYLIFALQYIPAGFVLCRCCEKSGSIWTSVAFHMSVNLMSMTAMR